MTERSWETKGTAERGKREAVCPQTRSVSNPPLFSSQAAPDLLGEFDRQLCVCQSIMWFLSHNRSLISLLFRKIKIHIHLLHTNMSSPHIYRRKMKFIIMGKKMKETKTTKPNSRTSTWNCVIAEDQNVLCSLDRLRARTVNWRRSISIKR